MLCQQWQVLINSECPVGVNSMLCRSLNVRILSVCLYEAFAKTSILIRKNVFMLIKNTKKLLPGGELTQQIKALAACCSHLTLSSIPRTYTKEVGKNWWLMCCGIYAPTYVIHLHTHTNNLRPTHTHLCIHKLFQKNSQESCSSGYLQERKLWERCERHIFTIYLLYHLSLLLVYITLSQLIH